MIILYASYTIRLGHDWDDPLSIILDSDIKLNLTIHLYNNIKLNTKMYMYTAKDINHSL